MIDAAPTIEAEGPLSAASAPLLLAQAWREKRTGRLRIIRDKHECVIQLVDGAPISAETNGDEVGLARTLENKGTITLDERRKVEQFARERHCPEASALLALGLLDAKALYRAVRDMTRSRMCEVFDWNQGSYAWTPGKADKDAKGKPFDILKLMQEQLASRWGIERLFEALLPHSEAIVELTPNFRRVANKLGATGPIAQKVLDALNGSTSIGQLLGESAGDPLAAATLWVLVTAGLVRNRETMLAATEQEYDFEVVVAKGLGRTDQTAAPDASATARASNASNPKVEALRAEITSMLSQLGELTHYAALGVELDARPAEIKRAYFRAAKKYHPDSLARLDLGDMRDQAAQVFGRIAEAFETLSNDAKRAAYDSGDGDQTEIDTARLTQAETSFRKGEILVKMGNFVGALEYLEPAVDLWPDEPAYHAELGWALFRQPQSNPARAQEHLEISHRQQPDNAHTLYRLGLVLRALGDNDASEDRILSARAIDPNVSD